MKHVSKTALLAALLVPALSTCTTEQFVPAKTKTELAKRITPLLARSIVALPLANLAASTAKNQLDKGSSILGTTYASFSLGIALGLVGGRLYNNCYAIPKESTEYMKHKIGYAPAKTKFELSKRIGIRLASLLAYIATCKAIGNIVSRISSNSPDATSEDTSLEDTSLNNLKMHTKVALLTPFDIAGFWCPIYGIFDEISEYRHRNESTNKYAPAQELAD